LCSWSGRSLGNVPVARPRSQRTEREGGLVAPPRRVRQVMCTHPMRSDAHKQAESCRERIRSQRRDIMCPVCIGSTVVMVAGAGSTAGILALCIGKFRKVFRSGFGLFHKTKEK